MVCSRAGFGGCGANLFGLRQATWITGALLVVMLGSRWFFGLAGFCGWSDVGAWSVQNLLPAEGLRWFGPGGVVTLGLALGFWSFVGIEGTCALVEETRRPGRTIPRGVVLALVFILMTTLVMGCGVIGTQSVDAWRAEALGPSGHGGEAPHLAVGAAMFGTKGAVAMALASVAACLSTLIIAFAAMPRMFFAMARDGHFFGPRLSSVFASRHPRTGAPIPATLLAASFYLPVLLCVGAVVDCLYAAAYSWFFRYLVLHALALGNRIRSDRTAGVFPRPLLFALAGGGAGVTVIAFLGAFAGVHQLYASRALIVLGAALVLTIVAMRAGRRPEMEPALRGRRPGELRRPPRVLDEMRRAA